MSSDGREVGRILDNISTINGVKVNGVSFDQSDRELGVYQARKAAFESAKEKAEEYAQLSGFRIRKATRI